LSLTKVVTMKAIILARVSSKEQEEGQSIPAQIRRLTEYAERRHYTIEHIFQITESSTKETRKEFEKIIAFIKKSRTPIALIADTIDRVQRSFKESVILEELRRQSKVEIHFFRENLVLNERSNSADLLRWDMGVMFARSYVLQLSDNVKRSKEEALKKGIWIGLAPFGYLHTVDAQGNKTIILDPLRKHFITKLFELYATGNYSLQKLKEEMEALGLKTEKGRSIAKSQIEKILKNPFYYGGMQTKHGLFSHHYEPLISYEIFQRVQDVANGYHKKPFQQAAQPFILRGLIICSHCGCLLSPEMKKQKYVYYSCTNAKGNCQRKYIREEKFLETLTPYFSSLQLPDDLINKITDYLKNIHESESLFHKENLETLRKEQDKIQHRISRTYDDKLDGLIDEQMYQEKIKEYKTRQQEIISQMSRHVKADETFHLTANMVLNLARRAREIFESSEVEEKRQLLNFVFQNLKLEGEKLVVELREPFNLIADTAKCPMGWGRLDSNQRRPKSRDLQSVGIRCPSNLFNTYQYEIQLLELTFLLDDVV
jgi:site-specific DNA recombinase